MDESARNSVNSSSSSFAITSDPIETTPTDESKPYAKSIEKTKVALRDTNLAPIDKLVQIREMITGIKSEVAEFWASEPSRPEKMEMERSELLTVLMYILVQAQIDDLFAQLILMREFISAAV